MQRTGSHNDYRIRGLYQRISDGIYSKTCIKYSKLVLFNYIRAKCSVNQIVCSAVNQSLPSWPVFKHIMWRLQNIRKTCLKTFCKIFFCLFQTSIVESFEKLNVIAEKYWNTFHAYLKLSSKLFRNLKKDRFRTSLQNVRLWCFCIGKFANSFSGVTMHIGFKFAKRTECITKKRYGRDVFWRF